MRALGIVALSALLACGASEPKPVPQGAISEVVVVLHGSSEPLPFDPRGGRLTVVTRQITDLIGHPIVLELDTALSPELRASLEETVLASFETIARELVMLKGDDPDMFAQAKVIQRVECHYNAVAKHVGAELQGDTLVVDTPPDRFPLLERGVLAEAVYDAHIDELDKRFGEMDPTHVPSGLKAPWLQYMTASRPGYGYLWVHARASNKEPGSWERLRGEHVLRIVRFATTVDPKSELGAKTRKWLVDEVGYVAGETRLQNDYAAWLNENVANLDADDKLKIANVLFAFRDSKTIKGFDSLAFGMGIYDAWLNGSVHGELEKLVVCPKTRRGEAETEISFGCSRFFPIALADERFPAIILERHEDHRLFELALLNLGHEQGKQGVAFVEKFWPSHKAFFEDGVRILFHDHPRRDDVKSALDDVAARWWRDLPSERGLTLLIMGRRVEGLDPHYADSHWERWVKEFGGPVKRDVMTAFFAEGARAIEMAPKMWLAFAKGSDRDELVAKSLPALLGKGGAKVTGPLALLRQRYCTEKDGAGLASARQSIDQYSRAHPDAPAAISNAVVDYTLQRCAKPAPADDD